MTWIEIGAAGGLLFLAMLVAAVTAAAAALVIGYCATQWFDDVSRVEAMDGRIKEDDK